MQRYQIAKLIDYVARIERFASPGLEKNAFEPVWYPELNYHQLLEIVDFVAEELPKVGAPIAETKFADFRKALKRTKFVMHQQIGRAAGWEPLDIAILGSAAQDLRIRLAEELGSKTMLILAPERSKLLEPASPLFGEAVDGMFPDSAEDIEEAGKCVAYGLGTACVFHLMRAAESAAAVVSKRLGGAVTKDDEPLSFGGLFNEVSLKIEDMPRRGANKDAWLRLKGFMSAVNRGTRTKVSHPGTVYTEQKAEALFGLTKSFMEEAEELLRERA